MKNGNKPNCINCGDDRYTLHGCCGGRECGCMGMPVSSVNCKYCNPDGSAEPGEGVKEYMEYVEYVGDKPNDAS